MTKSSGKVMKDHDDTELGGSEDVSTSYDSLSPSSKELKKSMLVRDHKTDNDRKGFLSKLLPQPKLEDKGPIIKSPFTQHRLQYQILIWTMISILLSYISVFDCEFLKIGDSEERYIEMKGRGLFTESIYSANSTSKIGCLRYDSEVMETTRSIRWSRLFGGFLLMLVTFCFLITVPWFMFMQNMTKKRLIQLCFRTFYPTALFFNLLMCSRMAGIDECSAEGQRCRPGFSGLCAIFNLFVLLYLSILAFIVPSPAHPIFLYNEHNIPKRPTKDEEEKQKLNRTSSADTPYKPKPNDVVETTLELTQDGGLLKTMHIAHADGTKSVRKEFKPAP